MLDLPVKKINPEFGAFENFVANLPMCHEHWKYPDAIALSKKLCEYNGFNYRYVKDRLIREGYAVWGDNYYSGVHFLDKYGRWEKLHNKETYCMPVYLTQKARNLSREAFRRAKGERKIREVKNTRWHGLKQISDYHIVRTERIKVDVQEMRKCLEHEKPIVQDHARMMLDKVQGDCITMQYYINSTGRYTAIGQSLQNCHKVVRKAALKGKWSYDIDASQPRIYNQLYPNPVVEDFINRKDEIRKSVQKACGLSPKDAKQIITALQYGASLKDNFGLHLKFGERTINKARNNKWLKQWKEAWKEGKGIVSGYKGTLRSLPRILQRAEVKILQVIMDHYDIQCLLHDGWVSETRLDTQEMEQLIYKNTGFVIKINEEKL